MTAILVLTILLVSVTVAPLSRLEVWWIRGLDFPRLQFAAFSVVLFLAELIFLDYSAPESWVISGLTLLCTLYQGWWILPYTKLYRPEVKKSAGNNQENSIRLMIANVLESNRKYQLLLNLVEEEQPDFVATLETNSWWQEKLDVLESEFPHSIKQPMENRYGMHVYSKLPLSNIKVQYLVEDDVPSIRTDITLPSGKEVRIYIVHPAPPSPTENEESSERDAELLIVAKKASKAGKPVIVTGDLNDVAWSYTTRLFRKMSNLLDPRVGRGMFNTFHAKYKFVRWPLDHLFHSRHFLLAKIKRLAAFGSDHFPILVELIYEEGNVKPNEESLESTSSDEKVAEGKLQQKADESAEIDEEDGLRTRS